jgi:hypothetical protein
MKLARREGVQLAIVQVVGKKIPSELVEDSHLVRQIKLTVENPNHRKLAPESDKIRWPKGTISVQKGQKKGTKT